MDAIVEVLLALLAVVGLLSIGWLAFGYILSPAGGVESITLIPGKGDGEAMEQSVRGAIWLRGGGLMGGRILIVDCGLTSQGRSVAAALCQREPSVEVVKPGDLPACV